MNSVQRIIAIISGLGLLGGLLSYSGLGLPKESSTLSVRLESATAPGYTRTHRSTGSSFGK